MKSRGDDALKKLALDIVQGRVFGSWQIPNYDARLTGMVFASLLFVGEKTGRQIRDEVGAIYEYLDKAGSRSINGYPMFMSCNMLSKSDTDKLQAMVGRLQTAMREAL